MRTAYVKAQSEFACAKATREGQTGKRSFNYANHQDVYDACHGALASHGFAITHPMRYVNGTMHVGTGLIHTHGYVEGWFVPGVPPGQNNQDRGLALSYAKRYALKLCLGIPDSDKEDVENAANQRPRQGNGEHKTVRYVEPSIQEPEPDDSADESEDDIMVTLKLLGDASHRGVEWFRNEWKKLDGPTRKRIADDYKNSIVQWQRNAEQADKDATDPEAPPW